MAHSKEQSASPETDTDEAHAVDLLDKDFKINVLNTLNEERTDD